MKVVSLKLTGWNDVEAVTEFTEPVIQRPIATVIYQAITIL